MNSHIQKTKHRFASIILLVCMLLTLTSCSGTGSVYTVSGSPEIITTGNPKVEHHTSKDFKSVSKWGLYELFIDETNCSFALKDTAGGIWYALPTESNTEASLLTLEVTDGEKTYVLNSQDNSVAFGTAKYELTDTGIKFSYIFSEKKDSPNFKIPVTLTIDLADGQLDASVDCEELSAGVKGYYISSVSVLPHFGAVVKADAGDFLVIPDGSGALVDLAKAGDAKYSVTTYGADYAVEDGVSHSAIIAAFGLKNDNGAFAGIVTNGDAISEINAKTSKDGMDNIYASFNVTPNGLTETDDDEYDFALSKSSYKGKISVCYRFIAGSSATYGGLAAMCREQLIRLGMLSTRSVLDTEESPLNVTLVGGIKHGYIGSSRYTTFENAEEIAGILKAKGINALNIKYDGVFTGGLNQTDIGSAEFFSRLGNKKEYESLQSYMASQGFDLYLTANLITSNSDGSLAKGVLHNKIKVSYPNALEAYFGGDTFDRVGLSASDLTSNVVDFMNEMKDYNISGYCIGDAGHILYSDFSDGYIDRQAYSDSIFGQAIALSTNKNLMVEHGNLYTLKNALIISDIPMNVTYEETEAYQGVPFVQMILHGTVEYTGEYLNLAENPEDALLRTLEYGALPAFKLMYDDSIPRGEDYSLLYFDNWTSQALDAYTTFNNVLADLRGAKMTNHETIKEGVYCTEYNNETFIYVNYTDADVTHNNLTIKAGSYLRVN